MILGKKMYKWMRDLFPICRSICGPGFNQSLNYLNNLNLNLKTKIICEPFLTKYNLYKSLTSKYDYPNIVNTCNAISYADGSKSIFDISLITKFNLENLLQIYSELKKKKIIY